LGERRTTTTTTKTDKSSGFRFQDENVILLLNLILEANPPTLGSWRGCQKRWKEIADTLNAIKLPPNVPVFQATHRNCKDTFERLENEWKRKQSKSKASSGQREAGAGVGKTHGRHREL